MKNNPNKKVGNYNNNTNNNIPMIKEANFGVAMENSFKEVFKYAKFITKSNLESGVAFAINKFMEN